jgi:hypothetical protein
MANALPADVQKSALEELWRKYRTQAATSRRLKREQGQWRRVLLGASVIALIAAPVAKTLEAQGHKDAANIWSVVATLLFALTAFLNKDVLGDESQKPWVRARQAAEGIKGLSFAFLMGVSPLESPQGVEPALARAGEIASKAQQTPDGVSDEEAKKDLPPVPLTADAYREVRLEDQIRFYEKSAADERAIDARIGKISWALSAIIVLFGAAGGLITKGVKDIWAPALAAATATLTTQMARARHRYLIDSYSATAEKLRNVKVIYKATGSPAEVDKMVTLVEQILANENAGWVQQMLLKPVAPDRPAPPAK